MPNNNNYIYIYMTKKQNDDPHTEALTTIRKLTAGVSHDFCIK